MGDKDFPYWVAIYTKNGQRRARLLSAGTYETAEIEANKLCKQIDAQLISVQGLREEDLEDWSDK